MMQPGMMQPGMQPGMMPPPGQPMPGMYPPQQPGMMQPGMMQPGMMPPGGGMYAPKKRDRKKIIKDIDSELLSSKKAKLIYKKQVERNNDA